MEKAYGNFVLNKKGSVEVSLISLDGTAIQDAKLKILEFPGANQPQVTKSSSSSFTISWAPKASDLERIDFQVEVVAKIFGKVTGQTKDLVFTVRKDEKIPTVEEVTGLGIKNAQEGKNIDFSIIVKDPNFIGDGRPGVSFEPVSYDNTENYTASAHRLADLNLKKKPVHLGNGTFQFFYTLDMSKLPQDIDRKGNVDTNASKVTLCLNIEVVSVSRRGSEGTYQECLDAKYAAQPAKIELLSSNRKIKGSASIDVRISSESGTVNVVNAEKQIANLSGTKSINCVGLGEKSATCTIAWTPSCDAKQNTQKNTLLNLKAISSLNDSNKEASLSAQFTVDCAADKMEIAKQEIPKVEIARPAIAKPKLEITKPTITLDTPAVAAASGDKS